MSHFAIVSVLSALGLVFIPASWSQDNQGIAPQADQNVDKDESLKRDQKALVRGNNQFAFDLYRQLSARDGNIVLSPYSISSALAMTYAGARGDTAEQMAIALRLPSRGHSLHATFGNVIRQLQKDKEESFHLHVTNALWIQSGLSLVDRFLHLVKESYGAEVRHVDFATAPETSRKSINDWINDQTNGRIQELLSPSDVAESTRLILSNAIHFKAGWQMSFPKDHTKDADFFVTETSKVRVPMMHLKQHVFQFCRTDHFQLLQLPYGAGRLSMLLLLPNDKAGLDRIIRSLSADRLQETLGKVEKHLGEVFLPRFKVAGEFRLSKALSAMGMSVAFSERADLSGIAPGKSLRIQDVIHKAYVTVDEYGTEAAAGTAVLLARSAPPPFSFRADHPFLFLILDKKTGSILFMGRVTNPST